MIQKLIFTLLLVCIFLLSFFYLERQPTVETLKTEVTELPQEVRDKIGMAEVDESVRIPILMYHYVEYVKDTNDTIRQSLNINPDIFEAQVKALKEAGFTFLTMREVGLIIDDKMELTPKPVVLTFDDGHWDLLTDVLPILKKYKAKATVYIITDFLDGSDFLSIEQLLKLSQAKEIEIGAHTVHHAYLADRLPMTVKFELEESKQMLEELLNIWIVSFAYPNGALDLQAMDAVQKAGYWTAVSTAPGVNANKANRFALYRLRPGRRTGEGLVEYLEGDSFSAY